MISRKLISLAVMAACAAPGLARADMESDLRAQIEALQKQLDAVKSQLDRVSADVQKQKEAQPAAGPSQAPFIERKPGEALTFMVPGGGEVTLYGLFDVSFDYTTKGLKSDYGENGGVPVGKTGWQPAIATNLSRIGVKGMHPLQPDLDFIWQLEAGIDISATPGTKQSTSNQSDVVTGALFSRNTFLGFAGNDWGAVMIGKSETPYKTSTDRLNPFSGMLGDYRVILGNTGGDNASSSAFAPRTRCGTSHRPGADSRSRPCTLRARTATTRAASCLRPSRIARAATSPAAARRRRSATTARSATSGASVRRTRAVRST
jgi:hypothetical protein